MLQLRPEHQDRVIHRRSVALVPYTPEYITDDRLETHVGWLRNLDLMRYSEQRHRHHSKKTCAEWISSHNFIDSYVWSIETPEGYCGHVTAYGDQRNGTIDIGIMAGRPGFGTHAFGAAVDWLLTAAEWAKAECGTMEANKAMIKVALSAGMHFEGLRPGHFLLHDGARVGLCLFGKTQADVFAEWGPPDEQ